MLSCISGRFRSYFMIFLHHAGSISADLVAGGRVALENGLFMNKNNIKKITGHILTKAGMASLALVILAAVLAVDIAFRSKASDTHTKMLQLSAYINSIDDQQHYNSYAAEVEDSAFDNLVSLLDQNRIDPMPAVEDNVTVDADGRWTTIRMRVTGYCPCRKCCGVFSDGYTASGHRIKWGDTFVAADKYYRFGRKMVIPGYNAGRAVKVLDRGRDIYGYRLDVFFNSHSRAKRWGVKYLDVKVRY